MKREWTAGDGTRVTIRSIQPEDREIERVFVRSLSSNSKYLRFFSPIKDLSPQLLDRFTRVDYPREMAFIATIQVEMAELEIGVARYAPGSSEGTAEFAVVIADDWQGRGIGRELLRHLFNVAEESGLARIEGIVLTANKNMLRLCRELGFTASQYPGDAQLICINKDL
jgi:acetyltransferase